MFAGAIWGKHCGHAHFKEWLLQTGAYPSDLVGWMVWRFTCCKRDLSASSQLTTLLKTCISLGTRRLSERSTAMSVSGLRRFSVACVSACSSVA